MSENHAIIFALGLGLLATLPVAVVAYLATRMLRAQSMRHKATMEQAARRAFDNARLSNWQQIAASGMHDRHHYKEYRRDYNRHQHKNTNIHN